MFVVTYGDGDIALVNDDGSVFWGGSAELDAVLKETIRRDAPGDRLEIFEPGQPGHVRAALESLPDSTVTEDDD